MQEGSIQFVSDVRESACGLFINFVELWWSLRTRWIEPLFKGCGHALIKVFVKGRRGECANALAPCRAYPSR
jgi:hypothetical protein